MLSYIESGQSKLKGEIAIKLVDRLNSYIKNDNEKISYDYILKKPEEQVKEIIFFEIKNIKNFKLKNLDEFRKTFERFDLCYEHTKLFFILGKKLKLENITVAKLLCEEALDISMDKNIYNFMFVIVLELQRFYSIEGDFDKTIALYKKVEKYLNEAPQVIGGYINYNFALAFELNKDVLKAIKLYEKASFQLSVNSKIFYIKNNLSICYMNTGEYYKSKEIILELLSLDLSDIEKSKCYTNLIMNAVYTKDYTCLKVTIPKLKSILDDLKINRIIKYQSYFCLGKAYKLLENRYLAMINFEKELELGIGENRDHFFLYQYEYCIEELATIYSSSEKEKFKKLEKYILNIPKEMFNKDFFIKINLYFLKVYSYKEFSIFYEKISKNIYG